MNAEDKVNQIKSKLIFEIKNHMKDNDLTQVEMAHMCDVSQPRMSAILKGTGSGTIDLLIKVAVNIGIKNVLKKVML